MTCIKKNMCRNKLSVSIVSQKYESPTPICVTSFMNSPLPLLLVSNACGFSQVKDNAADGHTVRILDAFVRRNVHQLNDKNKKFKVNNTRRISKIGTSENAKAPKSGHSSI